MYFSINYPVLFLQRGCLFLHVSRFFRLRIDITSRILIWISRINKINKIIIPLFIYFFFFNFLSSFYLKKKWFNVSKISLIYFGISWYKNGWKLEFSRKITLFRAGSELRGDRVSEKVKKKRERKRERRRNTAAGNNTIRGANFAGTLTAVAG